MVVMWMDMLNLKLRQLTDCILMSYACTFVVMMHSHPVEVLHRACTDIVCRLLSFGLDV